MPGLEVGGWGLGVGSWELGFRVLGITIGLAGADDSGGCRGGKEAVLPDVPGIHGLGLRV